MRSESAVECIKLVFNPIPSFTNLHCGSFVHPFLDILDSIRVVLRLETTVDDLLAFLEDNLASIRLISELNQLLNGIIVDEANIFCGLIGVS